MDPTKLQAMVCFGESADQRNCAAVQLCEAAAPIGNPSSVLGDEPDIAGRNDGADSVKIGLVGPAVGHS